MKRKMEYEEEGQSLAATRLSRLTKQLSHLLVGKGHQFDADELIGIEKEDARLKQRPYVVVLHQRVVDYDPPPWRLIFFLETFDRPEDAEAYIELRANELIAAQLAIAPAAAMKDWAWKVEHDQSRRQPAQGSVNDNWNASFIRSVTLRSGFVFCDRNYLNFCVYKRSERTSSDSLLLEAISELLVNESATNEASGRGYVFRSYLRHVGEAATQGGPAASPFIFGT